MPKPPRLPLVLLAVLLTALLVGGGLGRHAAAQSGGGYDLSWSTVDGGGERTAGGGFVIIGTAGQPDAGALTNGSHLLAGGFWPASSTAAGVVYHVYLPLLRRSP